MQISLTYSKIKPYIFVYIALPFLIFSLTWLRFGWALVSAVSVLFILVSVFWKNLLDFCDKHIDQNRLLYQEKEIKFGIPAIVITVLVSAVWVWWSGIGGWFYQCSDFGYRNALFRDLITYDWPVIYGGEKGSMCYYIGYWIPAALIGKITNSLTSNEIAAWNVANTALYIWTFLGIVLTFLLLYFTVNAKTLKRVIAVIGLFIFFGGMDILGVALNVNPKLSLSGYHIEWWATYRYQLSSFTTCLFWVFNQTVIPWICTLLLITEKTPSNYVFIGMMCLFSGPFPFIGFVCMAAVMGIKYVFINLKNWKNWLSQIFSISNIMSVLFIFPIMAAFFTSNNAAAVGTKISNEGHFLRFASRIANGTGTFYDLMKYILFLLLEFLIVAVFIMYFHRKNVLFHVSVFLLAFFPLIHAGTAADFGMRATIPPMIYFFICVIQYLFENFDRKKPVSDKILVVAIIAILCIGAITPGYEFARGVHSAVKTGSISHVVDNKTSINNPRIKPSSVRNFTCSNYKETTFYKIFAKEG